MFNSMVNPTVKNKKLTVEQQIALLAKFFIFGAKVWDDWGFASVQASEELYCGHFTPGLEVGREFVVSVPGTEEPEFSVPALTTRSHTLRGLTPEPSAGTLEIDLVFKGHGCLLVREKYDRDAGTGGCGIYWLPKGQEEDVAEKLWEITADTNGKTMNIVCGSAQTSGVFELAGNTANCIDANGELVIGVEFDDRRINYNMKPHGFSIEFRK